MSFIDILRTGKPNRTPASASATWLKQHLCVIVVAAPYPCHTVPHRPIVTSCDRQVIGGSSTRWLKEKRVNTSHEIARWSWLGQAWLQSLIFRAVQQNFQAARAVKHAVRHHRYSNSCALRTYLLGRRVAQRRCMRRGLQPLSLANSLVQSLCFRHPAHSMRQTPILGHMTDVLNPPGFIRRTTSATKNRG